MPEPGLAFSEGHHPAHTKGDPMRRPIALAAMAAMTLSVPASGADVEPWRFDACLTVQGQEDGLYSRGAFDEDVAAEVMEGRAEVVGAGASCGRQRKPTVAVPQDGLVEVGQARWTELVFRDGGRKLDVYYSAGVPECYGLDRVEVTTDEAGLDVKVFVGSYPPKEGMGCPLPMHSWVTTVDLGERLALGSWGEREEAWQEWQDQAHEIMMAAVHELAEKLPGTIRFFTDERGREDYRLTAEGRAYALQFFENPETTRDDLVNYLLEREGLKPRFPATPGQAPFSEEWLQHGTVTFEVGTDTWTASCGTVKEKVCRGVAALFVNNLARQQLLVHEASAGKLAVERRSECPATPKGFRDKTCWQASAEGPDGSVCMVVAQMTEPLREKARSELGYGQIGGDAMAGRAGGPDEDWPRCE